MSKLIQKICLTSALTTYAIWTGFAAMAADTEIFFRPPPPDAPKPNILFIMSTGGTMNGGVTPPAGCVDSSKIGSLKCILKDIADTEDRVNFGLMRYNGPGGPVLYPIANLNASTDPAPVTAEIQDPDNDVLQTGLLSATHDADNTAMVLGAAATIAGFRFENVNIPQGATITSAHLSLVASDTISADEVDAGSWNILVEDSDNPITFDSATPENFFVSRTNQAAVNWNISATPFTVGDGAESVRKISPDLSYELNTIVNNTDWCGNRAVNLYITPDITSSGGTRTISTSNRGSDYSPQLYLEWDDSSIDSGAGEGCMTSQVGSTIASQTDDAEDVRRNATTTQIGSNTISLDFAVSTGNGAAGRPTEAIGLLFKGLNIPHGATIDSAYIEMTVKDTDSTTFSTDIGAIQDPGLTEWTDGFSNLSLGSTVNWTDSNDPSGGAWTTNQVIRSPDISSVIEQVVSLGGWVNGAANNIAINLRSSSSTTRRIKSADTADPARLIISYTGNYEPALSNVRQEIKNAIDDYKLVSNQPTAETYLEGYTYYSGGVVNFGAYRGQPARTTNRVSHPDSYQDGRLRYNSPSDEATCAVNPEASVCRNEEIIRQSGSTPVTYVAPRMAACQENHIVLLSDGSPSPLDSGTSATTVSTFAAITGETCSDNTGEDCAVNLAEHIANNDLNPDIDNDQLIYTHAIHFGAINNSKEAFGKAVAEAGDGMYLQAASGDDLDAAFETLISSLAKVNTSFVSAGITVNQSNRLTHRDELYFSLFRPEPFASWPGNVKRYRIFDGTILDSNDDPAIVTNADVFRDTAQSYWSDEPDGNDAGIGGAASELDFTATSRVTFSNITADSGVTPGGDNLVNTSNGTPGTYDWLTLLDVPDAPSAAAVLRWVMGYDVNGAVPTNMHNSIGDPLHSKPTILTYRQDDGSGSLSEFDMVFVGTNHGFLHSFYTESGTEEWSFIPRELLSNVKDYVVNAERAPIAHEYGVDGSITIYIDDINGDGAVDVEDGEKAYLYVGLRRGGSSYYAFDITDHDNPELMFTIDDATTGYSELGQTWSKPVVAKLASSSGTYTDTDGTNYDLVMMFGGGYDTNQDPTVSEPSGGEPSVDSVGRTIFMANALTGEKIWDARSDAMQYTQAGSITLMNSVPADVKAIDPRKPGYVEHIYASDTAGQVFRFDIDTEWDGTSSGTLAQGGLLASIQNPADGSLCSDDECNRRFYYSPDVAIIPRPGGKSFVSVSIGSGYRAHPLGDEISDKFFGIRDIGVLNRETAEVDTEIVETGFSVFDNQDGSVDDAGAPTIYGDAGSEVITQANLVDITNYPSEVAGVTAQSLVESDSSPKAGWILSLEEGEKVLAESITFNNRVIFTTYIPPADDFSDCAPAQGTGRAYAVNIVDGTPVVDFNNDGYTSDDRYVDLNNIGIPPEPQIIILGTGPELLIGRILATELIDDNWGEMDRIKWRSRKYRD